MKINSRIKCLLIVVLSLVVIGLSLYLWYGSTMVNPESESSMINYLSSDKEHPVEILASKKYKDCFAIVYTDPLEVKQNPYSSHFVTFRKHKLYSNRYQALHQTMGLQTQVMVSGIQIYGSENYNNGKTIMFIGNIASNETRCSVIEVDEFLMDVRKLDEIEVPQNVPYVIAREYELLDDKNSITVSDGSTDISSLVDGE